MNIKLYLSLHYFLSWCKYFKLKKALNSFSVLSKPVSMVVKQNPDWIICNHSGIPSNSSTVESSSMELMPPTHRYGNMLPVQYEGGLGKNGSKKHENLIFCMRHVYLVRIIMTQYSHMPKQYI